MDEKTEIPTSMADNEMLKHFAQEAEVRLSYIIRKRNFYFFHTSFINRFVFQVKEDYELAAKYYKEVIEKRFNM